MTKVKKKNKLPENVFHGFRHKQKSVIFNTSSAIHLPVHSELKEMSVNMLLFSYHKHTRTWD